MVQVCLCHTGTLKVKAGKQIEHRTQPSSFRMPAVGFSLLLLGFFTPFQPIQGEELRPPGNITVVSEDYSLFMKWLPPDGAPPGVSYTVFWMDSFDRQWEEVQHCRNITETFCNITCVFQEPSNRYRVKVEAESRIGARSIPSVPETIDYILQVQLGPPVLRAKYTQNILGVNVSFTYPSCMKDVFQYLTYDLEIWRSGFQKPVTLEDIHSPSVEVNTTDWLDGEYCLRARTSFRNGDRKWSNFSEPLCLQLHEEHAGRVKVRKSEDVALPLLVVLAICIGVAMLLFCYYKHTSKQVEIPSVLDFSKYQKPTNLLKFDERDLTKVIVHLSPEQKITPALLTLWVDSLSEESEESNDEDDSSSHIPYTETHRFQKKDENCSTVGTFPTCSSSSSGSVDSQRSGEIWPAARTRSKPLFIAEWMTKDTASGLLDKAFLSEDSVMDESVMDESVSFPNDFSAASREGQEITSSDVDFFSQLIFSESHHLTFSTGLEIRTGRVPCRSICASLENSQTSLCSEPEGQVVEEGRCENESSNCEALRLENSGLDVSCKDRVENGENNTLKSTGHSYQPRQGHYISRT